MWRGQGEEEREPEPGARGWRSLSLTGPIPRPGGREGAGRASGAPPPPAAPTAGGGCVRDAASVPRADREVLAGGGGYCGDRRSAGTLPMPGWAGAAASHTRFSPPVCVCIRPCVLRSGGCSSRLRRGLGGGRGDKRCRGGCQRPPPPPIPGLAGSSKPALP